MRDEFSKTRTSLRAGRRSVAVLALGLALTGCMSAGSDGPGLFGFAPGADASAAASGASVANAPELDLAGAPSTPGQEAAAPTPEQMEEVAAITPDAAAKAQARSPSMVAFAAPNEPGRPAGRSLYESLFTESEARTPVRNAESGRSGRVVVTQRDGGGTPGQQAALPGVDPNSLFEIGQRASVDDEDFLDDIGSVQVASLSGMARLAPSGFLVQREDIETGCFDGGLRQLLGQIERRFGERVVITSGYRSPAHNRRVNGAKASMHMACKAADLHVPGVSGQTVAAFVRSLPNRGGVGTYCHTAAIHVDVGRKRDWNWACRRRAG